MSNTAAGPWVRAEDIGTLDVYDGEKLLVTGMQGIDERVRYYAYAQWDGERGAFWDLDAPEHPNRRDVTHVARIVPPREAP